MNDSVKKSVNECIEGLFDKNDSVLSCGSLKDLPSRENVLKMIDTVRGIVFPRYFAEGAKANREELKNTLGNLYDLLVSEIRLAFGYDCEIKNKLSDTTFIETRAEDIAKKFIEGLPEVSDTLYYDIKATLAGDPAARSYDMIILTYPGIEAVFVYRIAHLLYEYGVPLIPRMMTEYAHSKTGIDINPGAVIGRSFVIDHGTGIVIGETTVIGEHVSIYQGVTLGAISLKDSRSLVGKKRHPTICDNVTIYAGATILGGDTVIGEGAVIGSSAFITQSVESGVTVAMEKPKLRVTPKNQK